MTATGRHGETGRRVYLDWNATAPLRPEARAAMLSAMDLAGNPSSVHAEGRAARAMIEKARGQVAGLVGCDPSEIVFTSGATEGARTVLGAAEGPVLACADVEHDAVLANIARLDDRGLRLNRSGALELTSAAGEIEDAPALAAVSAANGETGAIQQEALRALAARPGGLLFCDAVQAVGKTAFDFRRSGADYAIASAHKLGGPKGVGALLVRDGAPLAPLLLGGGQELGRRSGTENVIGIAGFGAAATAAQLDLEAGVWQQVEKLRDLLENTLEAGAPGLIFPGKGVPRLPNTSCFAVPGWRGETQVMQMDLAGFAVSAGSACSSGKVNRASRLLRAMGFDEETASSALRVSIGGTTTEAEVMAFADTWIGQYRRRETRAA